MPQINQYAIQLGASYKLIGIIGGAYGLTQILLRIPIGIFSDYIQKRNVFILSGLFICFISTFIVKIYPHMATLLICRLLAGIASATWGNFLVKFTSFFKDENIVSSAGVANAGSKSGQVLATFFSGFIAISYGLPATFLAGAFASGAAFILAVLIIGPEDEKKTRITVSASTAYNLIEADVKSSLFEGFNKVINNKIIKISILGLIIQSILFSTAYGFTPIIANKFGADSMQLGLLTTVFNIPQVIFSILSGTFIAKRVGSINAVLMGFIIVSASTISMPFADNLVFLFVLQFFTGVGIAISFSLLLGFIIKAAQPETRNTSVSFFQAMYSIGMTLGPIITGFISEHISLKAGFFFIGLTGIIGIIIILNVQENSLTKHNQ
jgi:MFS family permease